MNSNEKVFDNAVKIYKLKIKPEISDPKLNTNT